MLNNRFGKFLFRGLLLFGLCLVGGGVYLSIWTEKKGNEIVGPTLIRKNINGDLWIRANSKLYQLDDGGKLIRAFDPAAFGINDLTDLVPLDSGELLIGDKGTNEVGRYSQDGKRLHSFVVRGAGEKHLHGNFKLTVDPETGGYYMADPSNHRVRLFDKEGLPTGEFGQEGSGEEDLHFPNLAAVGPDHLLYIADTNNHRISIRTRDGKNKLSLPTSYSRHQDDDIWPTYFGFLPAGRLAVINKGPSLVGGEIAIIAKTGEILRTIALPDPSDIVIRDEDLLVTDQETMMVLRFSHEGKELGIFGQGPFLRELIKASSERKRFRSMGREARAGLLGFLFLLLVLLPVERYRKTRRALKEDRLRDRTELKRLPFEKIEPIKKWAYYGTLVGTLVVLYYFAMRFLIQAFNPRLRIKNPSLPVWADLTLSLILLFSVSFILRRGVKRGFLREDQIKAHETALKKFGPELEKALLPGEKIRMVSLTRKLPRGFEACLRGLFGLEILFWVVTDSRMLFLSTDVLRSRVRRIREIGYDGIREIKIGPRTFIQKWITRSAGAEQLTLFHYRDRKPVELQVPSAEFAEALKEEIERCKAGARGSFARVRDLCRSCYSPILISQALCPRCRKATAPKISPAMLSLLFPGLGQFSNHALFKGALFSISATSSLCLILIHLYAWYYGTAEVNPHDLLQSTALFLLYWLGSVTEAYYAAKDRL